MSCDCRLRLLAEFRNHALFDEGVEAARNACVAGAPLASAAITASAWYSNPLTGAGALRECLRRLLAIGCDVAAFRAAFAPAVHPETRDPNFSPGFGFVAAQQAQSLLSVAAKLGACPAIASGESRLQFYLDQRAELGAPCQELNQAGLAALVFADHGMTLDQAEAQFLIFRVEVALEQAARARQEGVGAFPFFSDEYVYEGKLPPPHELDLVSLMREVGLD